MQASQLLVLGGTGFVGRALVRKAGRARRRRRRADPRRRRAACSARQPVQPLPTVEVAVGDVHDDATLARLLRGTDAVINLVAILHGSEAEFERVHVRLPRAARRRLRDAPACAASSTSARSASPPTAPSPLPALQGGAAKRRCSAARARR